MVYLIKMNITYIYLYSIYLLLKGEAEINQALTLSVNKGESDKREKS